MIATPTSTTHTIIVQVQRNVMKEHTGIYIHSHFIWAYGGSENEYILYISCLQAVDYLQANAIITGKHCVYVIDNKCFVVGSAMV